MHLMANSQTGNTNIDFSKHAPRKYESANYLEDQVLPKPGAEHVQDSLFSMADEKIINGLGPKSNFICRLCRD